MDVDPGQVVVSGVLYEVQLGSHNGSALGLAGSILGGKLNVNFGAASLADNFLSFKTGTLSAIVQALKSKNALARLLTYPTGFIGIAARSNVILMSWSGSAW